MKAKIKIAIKELENNHFGEWLSKRIEVANELSSKQSVFCICGKLATGMHENGCKRFNDRINMETAARLAHLLKN